MNLTDLVVSYATPNEKGTGINIDIDALSKNKDFLHAAVQAVLDLVKKNPDSCVVVPSYDYKKNTLRAFVNELALSNQIKTLVTGDVSQVENLHSKPQNIILVKKSFRAGEHLREQVQRLQALPSKVSVFCFISHYTGRMKGFAYEMGIEVKSLVQTDDKVYATFI